MHLCLMTIIVQYVNKREIMTEEILKKIKQLPPLYGISNDMFSALSKKWHGLMTAWCIRKENKLLGILSPSAFLVDLPSFETAIENTQN